MPFCAQCNDPAPPGAKPRNLGKMSVANSIRRFSRRSVSVLAGSPKKNNFRTVIVEGNIASGKTEFLRYFKETSDAKIVAEPVEKWRNAGGYNLLDLVYKDPSRWSLTFQTYVQLTMLDAHTRNDAMEADDTKIMERSIYSAKYCFVENLYRSKKMEQVEYSVLTEWFNWITENANCSADLIVYLRTDPKTVYERLLKRRRPEERNIPLEYLEALHELHEDWLIKEKFPLPALVLPLDANQNLSAMFAQYESIAKDVLAPGSAFRAPGLDGETLDLHSY